MKLIAVLSLVMLVNLTSAAVKHPSSHPTEKATLSAVQKQKITPELDPVSDNKFFAVDYPDDARTPQFHHFGHPYPTVQDSDHYDKDYVEDSNDDGGYWSAQMRYDKAKTDLMKQRKDVADALAKLKKEEEDVAKAKAAEQAAEDHAEKKEADENASDKLHDTAQDKLDQAKIDVDTGAEKVENEVLDIEECKKQLEKARKKLEALIAEKVEYEKQEAEKKAAEKVAEEKRIAAEKKEEELEKKIKEEEGEHATALKHWKEEQKDVERVTKELNEAAERLRKFRHADPDGGVTEVKAKGAAWKASGLSGFAMLVATMLLV